MRFKIFFQFVLLLTVLLITGSAVGEMNGANSGDTELTPRDASFFVELGGANDPDAIGGTVGITIDASEYFTYNGGLTYLGSEHSSDVFGGASLGIRTRTTKYPVMPFVGLGVFSGITKATVPADDDGKDNDDDGEIDESGEEDEIIDDVLCSFYPEVGLNVMLSKDSGVMLVAKRHFTTEGSEYRFWMYSMVFSIYF